MSERYKAYLGDSVYAAFDGRIVLTTENGLGPSNTIVMEPEVVAEFLLYLRFVKVLESFVVSDSKDS